MLTRWKKRELYIFGFVSWKRKGKKLVGIYNDYRREREIYNEARTRESSSSSGNNNDKLS